MQRLLITIAFLLLTLTNGLCAGNVDILPAQFLDSAKSELLKKDFQKAGLYVKLAIAKSEQTNDTVLLLKSLKILEQFYSERGQNDSAIDICHKRLILNRLKRNYISLSDNFRALNTLLITNIGSHTSTGLLDSCLYYALLSKDNKAITVAYTNYGTYIVGTDKRRGLEYLKLAIKQSNSTPNEIIYIYARVQAAETLIWLDSLRQATLYLDEALDKAIQTNEKIQRAHVYIALGQIDIKEERYNEAISNLHKARIIAEQGPYLYYLPDIFENLALAFRKTNTIDSSFFYRDKATSIQQQLVNEKTNQQVAEVNAKYQLEGKLSTIEKQGVKIGIYKKFLLIIGIGLAIVITFFSIYIFKINSKNKKNGIRRGTLVKGAKKNNSSLPKSFKGKFEDIFIKGESYTQSDISLQKLSELLSTNTTYLSRFINEEYKTNFSQLLNHYRIEKACSLLLNSKMNNLTIEAIAQEAGFNSKSAFNTSFRKQKGITPTLWRETTRRTLNE
jgi:AraC-like DNA-binding protein